VGVNLGMLQGSDPLPARFKAQERFGSPTFPF